ncbi:MAG: arsenite methyltransferase [Acidimicrobiales bacterium]|jgi:SAM-dependent methyltransferase
MTTNDSEKIYAAVRDRYANAARAASSCTCCGPGDTTAGVVTSNLYEKDETDALPSDAVAASLGCGNPTVLAELQPGEVVLDLGSGGGIDVLLSARRVGPGGMAYGLDMTPEMLELARKNQAEAGLANVEFLQGTIEDIPLPDETVDVVISNCVVNLSPDKDAVVREAFRVLKPGGRLAIADIVLRRGLSEPTRALIGLWTGCVAGALVVEDYESKLRAAGFDDVSIEPTRVFGDGDIDALEAELSVDAHLSQGIDRNEVMTEVAGSVMSASVRARKPDSGSRERRVRGGHRRR